MNSKIQTRLEANMKDITGITESTPTAIETEVESTSAIKAGVVTPFEQEVKLPDKISSQEVLPAQVDSMREIDQDYMFARKNIRELIEAQQTSIENLMLLAEESEKARDFEVLAEFSKQILDANHGLLDLQLKYARLRAMAETDPNAPTHITNVAYIGTTEELQALVNGRKRDKV